MKVNQQNYWGENAEEIHVFLQRERKRERKCGRNDGDIGIQSHRDNILLLETKKSKQRK